jgi:flagellar biosynthesis protein FlhG
MEHPVAHLNRSDTYASRAKVFAVTSGKGGVGKTNIAANLAICLAALKRRVLLLDADISLANLDLVLNIRSTYNLSHVISGRKHMEDVVRRGPAGVRVVCGASGLDTLSAISEVEQRRLLQHLSRLQHETDTIIVDTAAGVSSCVVRFCLASDHVLVVTTPEATAMADAYGMIKVLVRKHYDGPISLLVNMARSTSEGKRVYQRMADVTRRFLAKDLYFATVLLKDERLCTAVRTRKPMVLAYPKSPISLSLAVLAAQLGGTRSAKRPSSSFFGKVLRR